MYRLKNRKCNLLLRGQAHVIQIKISAEYRYMLPRPRLVCQEPGVPDKSNQHVPVFCTDLNLFYSIHFLNFFNSSVGLVENFAGLPSCTVPSAIVHCNQNEAGHQTIKAPSMPCWGAASQENTLWHSWHKSTGLVKLTDKMDKICINGKLSVQEPIEWRVFCIPVSNFTVFQPRI